MRLVRILISRKKRDEVLAVLEEVDVDYVLTGDVSTRTSSVAVSFALPVVAVEPVLDRVRDTRTVRTRLLAVSVLASVMVVRRPRNV